MPRTKCGFNNDPSGAPSGQDQLVFMGPTLLVDIGFDSTFNPQVAQHPQPGTLTQGLQALVDTGAIESCIDRQLAEELGLPIIDRRQIAGVGGRHEVNIHLAQIYIPSLAFTIWGNFAAVDLLAGGQTHRALIGRTFLRSFTMIYTGTTGDVELYS